MIFEIVLLVGIGIFMVCMALWLFGDDKPKGMRTTPNFNLSGKKVVVIIIGVIVLFFLLAFSPIVIVPAGTVGVKDTFGSVAPEEFQPGIHVKNPFTSVKMFSIRAQPYIDYGQSDTVKLTVLSNEGLDVSVEYAIVYRIVPDKADELYKTVGYDYPDVIMRQPIHSVPRDIISRYDAKTLYSANTLDNPDRLKIEQSIQNDLIERITPERGIIIEQVALRNIVLPKVVTDAISVKMSMEQEIATKRFEVEKEKAEADRKIAEAQGIARSNEIISNSLTENYLKWYWLQNLENHESTAYFQVGSDGFPVSLSPDIVKVVA